jgi:hypothetical protein
MMILEFTDWYLDAKGSINARALQTAIERLKAAQARGFAGVRMSGNSFWLERKYWTLFSDYEKQLHAIIRNSRIVVLCSYSQERCTPRDVVEVMNHHDYALSHGPQGCERMAP